MKRSEIPVLIVGAGPAGLMTALLLRRLGVACRIVERRAGPQRAPAAHVVNARTFEICRQAGVDMAAIAAAARPPAEAGATYWVTKLGGEVLGSLPFERQEDDVLALTPTPLRNLAQHRFEPILLDALAAAGAERPLFGQRWMQAEADGDGVTSTIAEPDGGRSQQIRSRFLIAADGAGSPVRRSLGIAQIGPERLQSFVMIHFTANLRALVRDCPGVLYWVTDPDCTGIFVAHDIDHEWVFMHSYDPEREPASSYDTARCEALVRRALARDDVELAISTVSPWAMSCQVAERYRDGRILLVGDAAHRFPPTGGLGLNTGVQDAHNLAWKLAAVLDGSASETLLDTYQAERQPVAQFNAEQSLQNALRLLEVPQAFGFSDDLVASRRAFAEVLGDASRRSAVAAAIANQAEHFDMLGLQLGFAYRRGALLADEPESAPDAVAANAVRDFVPTSRPGARLPHGWLRDGARRRSTLDLIRLDRPTLLVGPQGGAWLDAAAAVSSEATLARERITDETGDADDWWTKVAGMRADGALLVRPDQHVAFRARGAVADPVAVLRHALAATFCRDLASAACA